MTSASTAAKTSKTSAKGAALTKDELVAAYRNMIQSRMLDDKMLVMLKQGKSYFHIGGMGHEAVQTAAALALTKGRDWAYPYYRDQAICTGLGMTAFEIFCCFLAKGEDPNSGGRQMPQHYGHKKLNIPSQSSPTGTQYLQAVGCALAAMRDYRRDHPKNGTSADLPIAATNSNRPTTNA